MRPANIRLHIEELVLHAFAPGDRYTIADAVERELSRLLAQPLSPISSQRLPETLAHGSANSQIDAGAFNVVPGSRTDSIGAQIAQAVHGGLTK